MKCCNGDIKHLTTVGMIVLKSLHISHYITPYIYMFNETLVLLLHKNYYTIFLLCQFLDVSIYHNLYTINCLEIFVIINDR